MADDDKKIEFEMKTVATGDGAEVTSEGQDKVLKKTEEATHGFEGQIAALDRHKAAMEEDAEAVKESFAATDKLTASLTKEAEARKVSTKALMDADVEKAKELVANREAEKASTDSATQVAAAGKVQMVLKTTEVLKELTGHLLAASAADGKFAAQLAGSRPAIEGASAAVDIFSTGLNKFVETGNPVEAVLAALQTGVGHVTESWDKMREAQKKAAESKDPAKFAEQLRLLKEGHENLRAEINKEFTANYFKEEADEIERAVKAQERFNELLIAQNNANVAKAEANVTVTQNTGGDVNAAKTEALSAKLNADLTALNIKLDAINGAATQAQTDATNARMKADEAALKNQDNFKALDASASSLQKKADDTLAVSTTAAAKIELQKEVTTAQYNASLTTLQAEHKKETEALGQKASTALTGATADLTGIAKTVTDGYQEFKKQADEAHKTIPADIERQNAALVRLITDKIPDSQQANLIKIAIDGLTLAMNSKDAQFIQLMTSARAQADATLNRVTQLQRDYETLLARSR